MLTKSVTVSSPALDEIVPDAAADVAAFELVEDVAGVSVALATSDFEAGEAEEEDVDEDAMIGKPSCQLWSRELDAFNAVVSISDALAAHSLVVA